MIKQCVSSVCIYMKFYGNLIFVEALEEINLELRFVFFRSWEMGFNALGLGFMKQKQ